MIDIMAWDDWVKLTEEEQEVIRKHYTRPRSKALPNSLSVEEQRAWLNESDTDASS